MLLLGLLSILQVTFLPGFLTIKAMRINGGMIKTLVLSFALSLIINHFIILTLTAFHIYNRWIIYSIFVVECLLLMYVILPFLKRPIIILFAEDSDRLNLFIKSIKESKPFDAWITTISILLAVATLLYYCVQVWANLGQIFNAWDAIVSWNRWAVDWYHGSFPTQTWHYPQLLPTLWSISYIFLGDSSIQFFAKAIMPLFPLFILLLILDLGLRTKQVGYIFSISITGVLLIVIMGGSQVLSDGYADIPVAFMAFFSVYLILITKCSDTVLDVKKNLILGSVCCAGCALTKQAGLYMAVIYPILCYLLVLRFNPNLAYKDKIKIVFAIYAVITILVIPWYTYIQIRINYGLESSEINYVTTAIHQDRSLLQRLLKAVNMLEDKFYNVLNLDLVQRLSIIKVKFGMVLVNAYIVICLVMCTWNRSWKYLVTLVVVPFFFIWAFYFSYSERNLALAIPFIGVALGMGTQFLKERFHSGAQKLVNINIFLWISLVLILILAVNTQFDKNKLIQRQLDLQIQIGDQWINDLLLKYHQQHGFKGKVISNYQLMKYIPEIGQYYVLDHMNDVPTLIQRIGMPDIQYLLFRNDGVAKADVKDYIAMNVTMGGFEQLSTRDGVLFIKINRGIFNRPLKN